MVENKLFLEELKNVVEAGLKLNEYVVEQLQNTFGKSSDLITQLYQLLLEKYEVLPATNDIEAEIYSYLMNCELQHGRTLYGATLAVAEMFDVPQTYVKYKVKHYIQPQLLRTA